MGSEVKSNDNEQGNSLSKSEENTKVQKTDPAAAIQHEVIQDGDTKTSTDQKPTNPTGDRKISTDEGEVQLDSTNIENLFAQIEQVKPMLDKEINSEEDENMEFYMDVKQDSKFELQKIPDKIRIIKSSILPTEIPEQVVDNEHTHKHAPRNTALMKKLCKIKKLKCLKKNQPDDKYEKDPSTLWTNDGKPLPVVRGGISSRDQDENCNAYCKWLKRQLVLEGSDDKLDSIMTLSELGIKYHKMFGEIRCVLVNLNGTLLIDNVPTQNSIKAIQLLRKFGIKIRFITNTTQYSRRLLLRRLIMLGFHVEPHELYTSLNVARELIESNKIRPYFLVEESAMEDLTDIKTSNPNAVVVGLSPTNFDYLRFNKALRLVMAGAPIIGIQNAKLHKLPNGLISMGPGPFISALEYATSGQSYIVGKPSENFFRKAIASIDCSEEETVVIGDDIRTDIEGALKCGMKGILVQTGKYHERDESILGDLSPDLVAKNFYIAVRCIVGAVAAEHNMRTGESDTEDHSKTLKHQILKDTGTANMEFLEKIQAYVNNCGRPVWCQEVERPAPPRLKIRECYTKDTGLPPPRKLRQINKRKSQIVYDDESQS